MKRDLGIEVELVKGHYGEYTVLVDDQMVIDGGPLTALGVVPASEKVVDAVRAALVTAQAPQRRA
jgi:hypothetical protein